MSNDKSFNRWAKKSETVKETPSEPVLKPHNPILDPDKQQLKPDIKISESDITESISTQMDYSSVKRTENGISFEIKCFNKDGIFKKLPVSFEQKQSRHFATRILHMTSKYAHIYKIIDE